MECRARARSSHHRRNRVAIRWYDRRVCGFRSWPKRNSSQANDAPAPPAAISGGKVVVELDCAGVGEGAGSCGRSGCRSLSSIRSPRSGLRPPAFRRACSRHAPLRPQPNSRCTDRTVARHGQPRLVQPCVYAAHATLACCAEQTDCAPFGCRNADR